MHSKDLAQELYELIEMAQFKHPIIAEELKEAADSISANLHISLEGWRRFYETESNPTKWVIEAIIKGISLNNILEKKLPAYERKYECGYTRFSIEKLQEKIEKKAQKEEEELEIEGRWDNIIKTYEDDQL
jgi:hypothetical protein